MNGTAGERVRRSGRPGRTGAYHPEHRCAFCGADVHESGHQGLVMVVIKHTDAWGWRCIDSVGCVRRRTQLRLFDAGVG